MIDLDWLLLPLCSAFSKVGAQTDFWTNLSHNHQQPTDQNHHNHHTNHNIYFGDNLLASIQRFIEKTLSSQKKARIYFLPIVLAVFENFKFHRSVTKGAFSLLIFMRMIALPEQLGTEKDEGQISRNCQLKCRRFDLKRSFQRNKVKFKRKSILTCL